jgi:hypothetical protein
VWETLPNLLVSFGVLGALVTVFGLGPAVSASQQNTDLRRDGVRTTAEVLSVRKQHHDGRHGSWDEWIPTTGQSADGVWNTTELGRYSSRDEQTFHRGQRFTVLVDPHDPDSVVPASDAARDRVTSRMHTAVGVAVTAGVFLSIGVPVLVHRRRRVPKRQRRREAAARASARARAAEERAQKRAEVRPH